MKTLFDMEVKTKPAGDLLRDRGIERAASHADYVCPNWSEKAYLFLLNFIEDKKEFMTEQVREAAAGIVPQPPSGRAWGAVIIRAAKSGLIAKAGYRNVKNPNAHSTPATVWNVIKKSEV